MKLKNVVEGTQIEAKRNTTGECGEAIAKGAVLYVTKVLEEYPHDTYRVRVDAEYLAYGLAWVDPADFRKVKEVTEKPTEHVYKVGDAVLVGSEGAGYRYIDRDLANRVCTVTAIHKDGCLRVSHPEVTSTFGYRTYPRYVSPYVEPVEEAPTGLHDFREGDVLLCTTTCEGKHQEKCIEGRLYKYIAESKNYSGRVCVGDPELYLEEASVHPENFTLYSRKVGEYAAL